MPKLPDGIPQSLADAFAKARSNQSQLSTADALVTKLTADLAQANADEATAKLAARDTLKAAESAFDDYVASLRANLESYVTAPDDAPPVSPPADTPPADAPPVVDPNAPPADGTVPN